MADKHTVIQTQVIIDWSVQKRGRLFICTQGTFRAMHSDAIIRVCPYPGKVNGFPDLFGWEYDELVKEYADSRENKFGYAGTFEFPIFCMVEVKTKQYSKLSQGQIDHLNYCVSIGGRAYVAREADNEVGYVLEVWKKV